MIERYLRATRRKLHRYKMSKAQRDAYLETMATIIEEKQKRGVDDLDIIARLPDPHALENELGKHYALAAKRPFGDNVLMMTPLVSLVLYGAAGFFFQLWHPGWLIFLAIPVVTFSLEVLRNDEKHNAVALFPWGVLTLFILLMWLSGDYHPWWALVVSVPLVMIMGNPPAHKQHATLFVLPFLLVPLVIILGAFTAYALVWPLLLISVYGFIMEPIAPRNKRLMMFFIVFASVLYYLPVVLNASVLHVSGVFLLPLLFKEVARIRFAPIKSICIVGVFILYWVLALLLSPFVAPSVFILLIPLRRER